MLSTEDGILCLERFRTIEQPDEEEEEEIIGKAKECYSEGEKGEIKKKHHHHHHYIVDEDGTRIETLMADVEISLTDDERKQKAAFDDFVSKIDRETPKTEVIQRRHEKKQERRERKEKKKNVVQQLQASISPTMPTRSANKRFPVLLVLDLDGTLVHSEFQRRTYQQHDFSLFNEEIFVYKRPYLDYFISTILEWFDVAVWTASGCEYAAEIVRHVFPDPSKVSFLFSSERCTNKYCPATGERIVIKDMKKVKRKGFDLRRVLIVDDTPSTWQRNYGNAVHIESYWGSRIDDHLLHLLTYLEYLGHESDVRRVDKRRWRNQVLGSVITHPASQTGQANDSESDSDC